MHVQPYLHFEGRCDEAIGFYQSALGAQVKELMRFKEAPPGSMPPNHAGEKVMHAALRIGDTEVLISDGNCTGKANFSGVGMTLNVDSEADAAKYFSALSTGGKVQVPLSATFFAKSFGMVTDKFGVGWLVIMRSR